MRNHKHKIFSDCFLKTFDFELSCQGAKLNKTQTMVLLSDKTSEMSVYIQKRINFYDVQASYITENYVKTKLGDILVNGNNGHKIQAAKILLGYTEAGEKAGDFINLIKAIKEGN